MLGKSTMSGRSSSLSGDRIFVYEVTGLKQNQANDSNDYAFRSSSNTFVSVPYSRMNEEMLRIGKMGGTIVNIQSLSSFQESKEIAGDRVDQSEDSKKSKKSTK